mgnify:CR=1 FL=1
MLEVRDITKIYNPGTLTEQRLFEYFSLTVEEGQFVASWAAMAAARPPC